MLCQGSSIRCLAFLVAAGIPLLSCSRTATSASTAGNYDQFGNRQESVQAETRLLTRNGEADLERAKAMLVNGKYRAGIGDLERLAADRTIDPDIRQEAILSVGEAHGSWLNPFRDYDKGMDWLQKLLVEYPDTAKRAHAEELIAQYKAEIAKQP